jgi:hypothetical protein
MGYYSTGAVSVAGAGGSGIVIVRYAGLIAATVTDLTTQSASAIVDNDTVFRGIEVTDSDSANLTVTFTHSAGILSVTAGVAGGLAAGAITGSGTPTLTLTGTVAEINATLAASSGLVYTPTANFNGAATLTMTTADGAGGSDTDILNMTVALIHQIGTTSSDLLLGTTASETFVGNDGDDALYGLGGADVMYGGAGNDVFFIDGSNITALQNPLSPGENIGRLARVDGGTGIDYLSLDGSDLYLDLTAVSNQGGGTIESFSRVESIERIDLTGTGNNTLKIAVSDVLDMAGMNLFNDDVNLDIANRWSGLGSIVQKHQVVVDGNAGDEVIATDWVRAAGAVSNKGQTYNIYNPITPEIYAQLLVDNDITVKNNSGVVI